MSPQIPEVQSDADENYMKAADRISVRIGAERLARMRDYCQADDESTSRLVRRSLDLLLGTEQLTDANMHLMRLTPPASTVALVAKYMAWAGGDVREERRRLFLELIAACFACKKLYPRTTGILEGYEGLLQLCEFFGVNDSV